MHREGRELDHDMFRVIYSLNKKKKSLHSLSAVLNLSLFVKLSDLPKSWRHKYFVIKHPLEFFGVRHLWVDKCHKVKRMSRLPSEEEKMVHKLYF